MVALCRRIQADDRRQDIMDAYRRKARYHLRHTEMALLPEFHQGTFTGRKGSRFRGNGGAEGWIGMQLGGCTVRRLYGDSFPLSPKPKTQNQNPHNRSP